MDPLVLVLVLLLLLVSASRATAWWRLVAASLLLGLLGYFRSEWLLFVPFAGLAFLAACRRRAVLVAVASMCLASLLILSPWLARTYALTGSMFLSASTGPRPLGGSSASIRTHGVRSRMTSPLPLR